MTGIDIKEMPTEVGTRNSLISFMDYKTSGTDQQGPSAAGRAALDAQKENLKAALAAIRDANTPENEARSFALELLGALTESEFKSYKKAIIEQVEQHVKNKFCAAGHEAEVEKFKFSLSELNAAWKELHSANQGNQEQNSVDPTESDVEPAEEEVDPAKLHNNLAKLFQRIVYFPDRRHQASICALFVMATYCIDAFHLVPYITISAPEKGCGKSTLFDLFDALVRRPISSMNASAAAVFRVVDEFDYPTILLDEVDTFLKEDNSLIGVLNSGIKRNGSVLRVEGDTKKKIVKYKTFGFKVLCGISARNISDTVADRSVIIELAKKPEDLSMEMFSDLPNEVVTNLRRRCTRLAIDAAEWMKKHQIPGDDYPKELSDRGRQKYRALFTVADYIDHIADPTGDNREYGQWARECAVQLSKIGAKQSLSNQLLENIRELLLEHPEFKHSDEFKSDAICRALVNEPTWGWGEINNGKEITPRWLSIKLGNYGIKPHKLKFQRGGRGYKRCELLAGMNNYLPKYQAENSEN